MRFFFERVSSFSGEPFDEFHGNRAVNGNHQFDEWGKKFAHFSRNDYAEDVFNWPLKLIVKAANGSPDGEFVT